MRVSGKFLFTVPLLISATLAWGQEVPEGKQTKAGLYVTAEEASRMLDDPKVLFIDVRSRAEVAFLGLPERVDKHVPYMVMPMMPTFDVEKGTYDLEINPDFPMELDAFLKSRGAGKDTPVILMCRSGSRSARAASPMSDLGYTRVYSMIDGFEGDKANDGLHAGHRVVNGWRNAGQKWSYRVRADQAYDADL